MIGERLSELRKDMGYTQQELADMLGISKFSISSYENDKTTPDDDMKVKLAKKLNVSIDYLLGVTDEPYPYQDDVTIVRISPKLSIQAVSEIKDFIRYVKDKDKR